MAEWVSFQELKQQVSMEDVLRHYGLLDGLKAQKGGAELVGLCPFHRESRGSFHVSTTKNAWNCFGCHKHGNILDFVAVKEGVDIRGAAVLIAGWFNVATEKPGEAPERTSDSPGTPEVEENINPPLTFELKRLNAKHPYLKERGLTPEAIEHFGLGYCNRGLMKGRIVIPIHNQLGELVAYAGRWPGEPPEGEERYILPAGFVKSAVVFNLHRVAQLVREEGLVLVEGFFSVFRLWQAGVPAVALMGSYLSEQQKAHLAGALGPQGKVALLLDNDDAGRAGAAQAVQELAGELFVKAVGLPEGVGQPDELSEQQLRQLLG